MGIIYLAALVLGLGTLTLQFVLSHAGGDAGGDADGDIGGDVGGDIGGDADDLALDGDHELEAAGEVHDHGSFVGTAAGVFLSMRFWTFALMAFGMVGTLLHYLDLSGFGLSLALAIASGLLSGFAAALTFRLLKGSVSSASTQDDAIGKLGQVTVPLQKGSLGKVRVFVKGKRIDLLAVTDAENINAGDEVVVVEFQGDRVYVEPIGKSIPPNS